jgi:epsin
MDLRCNADADQLRGRNDFVEIMEMLDKRLNDKGKNWRHVFKVCPGLP